MAVKDEVAHILFHVNAMEKAPFATPGADVRAQKVRDALVGFETDNRAFLRKNFLGDVVTAVADVELKALLSSIDKDNDGFKIRQIVADWVAGQGD